MSLSFQNDFFNDSDGDFPTNDFTQQNLKSSVWNHFEKSIDGQTAKCSFLDCKDQKPLSCKGGSTKGLREHLVRIHKIQRDKLGRKGKLNYNSFGFLNIDTIVLIFIQL